MSGYNSKHGRKKTMSTTKAKLSLFKGRNYKPCHYCGKRLSLDEATLDHVRALSRGGYDKKKNCVVACHSCNSRKSSMSAGEFFERLRSEITHSGPQPGSPASRRS